MTSSNGPKSRLREGLSTPGKKLTGTFMMLGGVRLAQCLGTTGLDVRLSILAALFSKV